MIGHSAVVRLLAHLRAQNDRYSSVCCRESFHGGDGLFASRDMQAGEMLNAGPPWICVPCYDDEGGLPEACDHCLRPLVEDTVECPICGIVFCSNGCLKAALVSLVRVLCLAYHSSDV